MSLVRDLVKEQRQAITTETYVSPADLAEQNFTWVGKGDGFEIKIKVPIPSSVTTKAFSIFFSSAFNNLLMHEIIEDDSVLEEMELDDEQKGVYLKMKEQVTSVDDLRKSGFEFLEYAFYILWNQDDKELLELIQEAQLNGDWDVVAKGLGEKARDSVLTELAKQGLEYPNAIENLIPMATELFYYINQLKKAKVRKIDEVKERLVETHRLL